MYIYRGGYISPFCPPTFFKLRIAVCILMWAGIAQSVQWLTMGWTVWGSNPSGAEIFPTHPDWPWGPPSLLHDECWVSFLGVKRPWHGIILPPPSSAEVKERVELYLYSPSGLSWPLLGQNLPFFISVKYDLNILSFPTTSINKMEMNTQAVTKFCLKI